LRDLDENGVFDLDEPAATMCGDGIVDSGEQCDDGNTTPGDGCSASCQTEGGPGPNPVGGMIVPIDTTALLVAGFENNALSVLGALTISAVAVFGVLYYSAKKKN
jgi:cysteine-rich repeat protein